MGIGRTAIVRSSGYVYFPRDDGRDLLADLSACRWRRALRRRRRRAGLARGVERGGFRAKDVDDKGEDGNGDEDSDKGEDGDEEDDDVSALDCIGPAFGRGILVFGRDIHGC